ncbi:MAG: hypothetical protein RIE74_02110 [Pseudomonadales bacterium]
MSKPCPVPEAAAELGIAPGTLKRWIAEGAPAARRGGRGRGNATLVDVAAVAAWRRGQGGEDALIALAGELPELLADGAYEAFKLADGPHKRALAGSLTAAWSLMLQAVLDRVSPNQARDSPEKIKRLYAVFQGFVSVGDDER